jgi:hypothetical protein
MTGKKVANRIILRSTGKQNLIRGLNQSPSVISYIMIIGSYGLTNVVFQVFYFSIIVRRWGERVVFITAMSMFMPIFLTFKFPVINFFARGWGQSIIIWRTYGY